METQRRPAEILDWVATLLLDDYPPPWDLASSNLRDGLFYVIDARGTVVLCSTSTHHSLFNYTMLNDLVDWVNEQHGGAHDKHSPPSGGIA